MTTAIIQARMSSSRLPGKVLMPILGKPMIIHQIERVKRSQIIDRVVVATSTDATDDVLVTLLEQHDIDVVRGPLHDVQSRFRLATSFYKDATYLRLTADCPLIDHEIIDRTINLHLDSKADYTSNNLIRSFPRGLDTEVFSNDAFALLLSFELDDYEREHVTPGFYRKPEIFSLATLESEEFLAMHRWTVDRLDDFEFVSTIYGKLYEKSNDFDAQDILELLNSQRNLIHFDDTHR